MKLLIFVALLMSWRVDASDAAKSWGQWVSEGKALMAAGKYAPAAQSFRQALVMAEQASSGNPNLAGIYDDLASAYAETGQYADSEREYRSGLAIVEKTKGRQSLDYALLIAELAVLPTQPANREFFITTLRQSILVTGRTDSVRELSVLRLCLAQILMDGKQYAEAEAALLDARRDFERLKRESPKLLAELLNELGVSSFNQGYFETSVERYRESLRLFEDAMGAEHPSLIAPLSNLGLSYVKLGRPEDAEPTLDRASILCGKTLGDDHPTCGAILENYAAVVRKLGRKREARALAARAQQIARTTRRRNGMDSTISVSALRSDRKP